MCRAPMNKFGALLGRRILVRSRSASQTGVCDSIDYLVTRTSGS